MHLESVPKSIPKSIWDGTWEKRQGVTGDSTILSVDEGETYLLWSEFWRTDNTFRSTSLKHSGKFWKKIEGV